MPLNHTKLSTKSNSGFGLIELLIAVALSSVVGIVVVQLFIQNKQSYLVQESLTRAQENGKYAINVLTNAIKSADFWGCIPSYEADTQNGLFNWPKDGVLNIVNGLPAGFVGINGVEGGATTGLAGYPSQPDTLTISGVRRGRSFPLQQSIDALDTGPITISVGGSTTTNIAENEILVISDCANAVIFQATAVSAVTTGTPNTATISHGAAPAVTVPPSPYNNTQTNLGYTFTPEYTTVFQGVSTNLQFTIDPAFDHDGLSATPPIPSLTRSIDGGAAEAIVPGVETMQVVYGIDTDVPYDFQADAYVNAGSVTNWADVVSVRISLLVRSPDADNEATPGYTLEGVTVTPANIPADSDGDFHTRKVYTTTIAIRNRTS